MQLQHRQQLQLLSSDTGRCESTTKALDKYMLDYWRILKWSDGTLNLPWQRNMANVHVHAQGCVQISMQMCMHVQACEHMFSLEGPQAGCAGIPGRHAVGHHPIACPRLPPHQVICMENLLLSGC